MVQVVQEDFADEGCGLGSGFVHAERVEGVDFGFEETEEEREEDLVKDGEPLCRWFMLLLCRGRGGGDDNIGPSDGGRRSEVRREETALQVGEGLVTDFATRIDALSRETAEDGGPVRCPCFITFEVGFGDEFGYAAGKLVDYGDSFGASKYDRIVPEMINENTRDKIR